MQSSVKFKFKFGLERNILTKIGIRGFKSICNLQGLEPGQVNLFIGASSSSKSNLPEAVGILSAAAAGRVDAKHLLERGVRHDGGLYIRKRNIGDHK